MKIFKTLYTSISLILLILAFTTIVVRADSVKTLKRTVESVAEGVYLIRHQDAPDAFPQGNTTVIIGDREVLVVDSCYLPSSAREDIAQIRKWTDKPVRYLVNTHWHYDHTMGNGTYWESFPSLTIVAHRETARQSAGYNPGWFERFPNRGERLKQILASGKDNNGKLLTEGEKQEYAEAIAGIAPVQAEFKSIIDRAPNLTFETELTINLGNREVQIKHLGRGNTAGDRIVYLPKEEILVSGDLLDHPVPYLFSGFPSEFVTTLRTMNRLEFQTVIPGHGEILRGDYARHYISQVADFIHAVVKKVSDEVHRIGPGARNLDAVREAVNKGVDLDSWRKKFAGDDKSDQDFFDSALAGLVTSAFAEVWGR